MWIPLPFPSCPMCSQSWVRCYHRGCSQAQELLVDPFVLLASCPGCGTQWNVMATRFHCSCGHVFDAAEVKFALSTAELLRQRMMEQIRLMDDAEKRIQQRRQDSFAQWAYDIAFQLGNAAGSLVGRIERWFG